MIISSANPTRRDILELGATVASAAALSAVGLTAGAQQPASPAAPQVAAPFTLPPLAYSHDAMEPHIDALTMQIHHEKHHGAFVTNLNKLATAHAVLATTPLVAALGQAIHGGTNWSPKEMFGVGVDYPTVRSWQVQRGGFFSERDVAGAEKVCVLGHTVAARLFQTADPVGAVVRIRNIPFRVIGVMERKGANIVGDDQDDILLMPYSTARKRLVGTGFKGVHAILVSARSVDSMHVAEREIRHLLADRHRIAPGQMMKIQQ
jgi:ABC-type antimicrobial peptide transport system permease subunit